MSIKHIYKKMLAVVLSVSLMSSCGPETAIVASGGIGGTGISWGALVAFGSVNVNGVHYDTSSLENANPDDDEGIWIDGKSASYSDLKVGMVVRVHGSIDADGLNGIATGLEYWSLAKGPAQSFNVADNSFTMLGQTVHVSNNTLFDDRRVEGAIVDLTSLVVEAQSNALYLEVSGYQAEDNTIYARRVEVKDDWVNGGNVRLMGTVSPVVSGTSFMIGSQIIYLDSVNSNLGGMYVAVEGTLNGETFTAESIAVEELGVNGNDREEFELEGYVTGNTITTNSRFTLNGQQVQVSVETVYDVGRTEADLPVGTEVEVEGYFDASGILIAEEIEFEDKGVELLNDADTIGSITTTPKTLIMSGGLKLAINNDTEIRDNRDDGMEQFKFSNFTDGQTMYIEYRYYVSGSDNIATRIDVENRP